MSVRISAPEPEKKFSDLQAEEGGSRRGKESEDETEGISSQEIPSEMGENEGRSPELQSQ